MLVLGGWLVHGGDLFTIRPVDDNEKVVRDCTIVSEKQVGLGRGGFDDVLFVREDGAQTFGVGRGLHRVRLACEGRSTERAFVVVLRGRSNVFDVVVPVGR